MGEVYMETGKPWCVIRGVWPGDPLSQPLEGFPDHTPETTQQRCPVSLYVPYSPPPLPSRTCHGPSIDGDGGGEESTQSTVGAVDALEIFSH